MALLSRKRIEVSRVPRIYDDAYLHPINECDHAECEDNDADDRDHDHVRQEREQEQEAGHEDEDHHDVDQREPAVLKCEL